MRILVSTSARARLAAARAFAASLPPADPLLVVGATRGAADDFARAIACERALFGVQCFSLAGLAARSVESSGVDVPARGSEQAAQAAAARVAFDADRAGELAYFGPVSSTPGFARALARSLHELRLAHVDVEALRAPGRAAADLAGLLRRFETELQHAKSGDRAALFAEAAAVWSSARRFAGTPVLLLDLPLDSEAERRFAAVVLGSARSACATAPASDSVAIASLLSAGGIVERCEDDADAQSDLAHLRRYIFSEEPPPIRKRAGDVRLFSAPGEGREAVEIARRLLDEAAAGVPFDEMAVFVRAPQEYVGLLEHAFDRAGVPAWFDRGTSRPDPSGRALMALVHCACENLSARRFDEYLSLAQVPDTGAGVVPAAPIPDDEAYERFGLDGLVDAVDEEERVPEQLSDEDAVVDGTLRAPWRWEELIVESAVIGGRSRADGRGRWRRRLDALHAEYDIRIRELRREEPESPRIGRYERDIRNLAHLRAFALPLIDEIAAWPGEASWGEWLDRLTAIAPRVLRRPAAVLRVLAEMRPMATIGPVQLEQVRDVLNVRLLTIEEPAPARRFGRVFVGTPHQARGRAFRVVFVPGLAERLFPQRLREDPLLLDEQRVAVNAALTTRKDRRLAERLLLGLAIGAATDRLYVSYPRLQIGEGRPRVPSFYALDVMRAITGRIPDHRVLAAEAADEAGASLAWPAPSDPASAIDDFEHDLAVLKPLIASRDREAVKGQAQYLLRMNAALRRSVVSRWARAGTKWAPSDGLIRTTDATLPALASRRLTARPYSLSALQRFAACPYQFLLASVHRLQPWDEPEPLMRLDPLTRGSLFHAVQAAFFRAMQADGLLPIRREGVPRAVEKLHEVMARVAEEHAERLAPAIERVWCDEIDEIRRDLTIWVQRLPEAAEWVPEYFEFAFGLEDEGRDPRSVREPVELEGGFRLRGSVDLIERHVNGSSLRVTDHKTGKDRFTRDQVLDGGRALQPVLYSLVVERALGEPVTAGRLFYCTTAGGFGDHPIAIDARARAAAYEALTIIDRGVELGRLPAAPDRGSCRYCDFRPVCGPNEEKRVARKTATITADLEVLRSMR